VTYFIIRLIPLLLIAWTIPVFAAQQHALVIGINQYKHAGAVVDVNGERLENLAGAVNDAKLLAATLRRVHVRLPENRVLLNDNATRAAFDRAWQDMLKQAQPGDTLIFTFSGHGGQLSDIIPLGEVDKYDEMLMFYDFHPTQPLQGSIVDDEMHGLLKKASADYNLVVIVDACHASGTTRSIAQPLGKTRNGGRYVAQANLPIFLQREDTELPRKVTRITGVVRDSLKIQETTIDNQWHGALSWAFAQALNGKADGDKNGFLERDELTTFLREKVRNKTKNLQTPKLEPSADRQSVIRLRQTIPLPTSNNYDISIVVENTRAPRGLKNVRVVKDLSQGANLRFVVKNRQEIDVFNNIGDKITTLPRDKLHLWQRVIDKERLLQALATKFDMRHKPVRITLSEGDKLHKEGDVLHFSIAPGNLREGLNALTLFNLAGNGELHFIYPLPNTKDTLIVRQFPYALLPPPKVSSPFGGDDLVAVLCRKPTKGLHKLLANNHKKPNLPMPEQILSRLRGHTCQVGQYAFFSSK